MAMFSACYENIVVQFVEIMSGSRYEQQDINSEKFQGYVGQTDGMARRTDTSARRQRLAPQTHHLLSGSASLASSRSR